MANPTIVRWVPPALRSAGNRLLGAQTRFRGPHASWDEATAASSGYDDAAIVARVRASVESVLRGSSGYEQDGSVGHAPAPSHALACVLSVAAADRGRLFVVDFGGSLATHYLRWRPWLERLADVRWHVIEQPGFVDAGRELFAGNACVTFGLDVESALDLAPNVVLVSGSLQYLPDPLATLGQLAALAPRAIVLDRTTYSDDGRAHLLTQHVPWTLGRASYPMWLLARDEVATVLSRDYARGIAFPGDDPEIRDGRNRGRYEGALWWRAAGVQAPTPAVVSSAMQSGMSS